MSSQSDEDLQNCLSKQPRRQPKPKRQVSSLKFSARQWRQRKARFSFSISWQKVPSWAWLLGSVSTILLFSLFQPYEGGPISEKNLANFPPPTPMNEIVSDGQSAVLITNAVPEGMRLTLKGEKEYIFSVEPCRDCRYTDDPEISQQFCDRAPEQIFYVPPGNYEVFVSFGGATSRFRSEWSLTKSWQYGQCIFAGQSWHP